MVLSEAEAEAQLASLRREREVLDRAIADLSLYLELGRRLTSGAASPAEIAPSAATSSVATKPAAWTPGNAAEPGGRNERDATHHPSSVDRESPSERMPPIPARPASIPTAALDEARHTSPAPGMPEWRDPQSTTATPGGPTEGALSEGVLARRYGRALIEAALAALEEADRPLHAAEILAVLTSRGFSLPGHDPVAALNTRLWKRSGPGGPIRRMGDAVYALIAPEEAFSRRQPMDEG